MSFNSIINIVLPKSGENVVHITGHYIEPRGGSVHGGVDFNYVVGQAGINLLHPAVYSPAAGVVEFFDGSYGAVSIRGVNGFIHQILHFNSQDVSAGSAVIAESLIGAMGGAGHTWGNIYDWYVFCQLRYFNLLSLDC